MSNFLELLGHLHQLQIMEGGELSWNKDELVAIQIAARIVKKYASDITTELLKEQSSRSPCAKCIIGRYSLSPGLLIVTVTAMQMVN